MSAFPYAMIGAGGLASALGGALGGAAQNRAGRQARDWYDDKTNAYGTRLFDLYFGPDRRAMWEAGGGGGADFNASIGGGILDQQKALADRYGAGYGSLTDALKSQLAGVNDLGTARAKNVSNMYGRAVNLTQDAYGGLDRIAGQHGAQRASQIREDANRATRASNQQTMARMTASGLGNSSLLSSVMGANAAEIERGAQRSLQDAADATTQMRLGVGAQGASSLAGLLSQRAGTAASMLDTDTARRMSSAGVLSDLRERSMGKRYALDQMPIDQMLSIQQGQIFNPWLGQNTSQYYPGQSGMASALVTGGNAAAGLGGMMYGQQQNQQLLEALKQLQG